MNEPTPSDTPQRQHLVESAGYWFNVSRQLARGERKYGEAMLALENAYNHIENAMAAALQERDTARAQLGEALADGERLDWLESMERHRIWHFAAEGTHAGQTLREAIDAARSHESPLQGPTTHFRCPGPSKHTRGPIAPIPDTTAPPLDAQPTSLT